jgi:hypothetical protein
MRSLPLTAIALVAAALMVPLPTQSMEITARTFQTGSPGAKIQMKGEIQPR